jgi:hypothetical protein
MKRILVASIVLIPMLGFPSEPRVLPVVAHEAPGSADNRWSSELYLSNSGSEEITVTMGGLLPGRRRPSEPCQTFAPVKRTVPAHSTVMWSAAELGPDIGCATFVLGGLTLDADGPVHIGSRLVNHRGHEPVPHQPLHGSGQVVDALALEDLPRAGSYQLPGLLWHRNACGPQAFVSYVGFANPGEDSVMVTLDLPPDSREPGLRIDGKPVVLPHSIEVPAQSWRQIRLVPEPSPLTVCMDPEIVDLWLDINGSLAFYGSVVDRPAQDPRTVTPIPHR